MGKCSEKRRKLSRYGCYAKSAAKWTAGKLKSGVERIGSFSGEQGSKHKYGFGLLVLAIIGGALIAGSVFFLYSPVSNPKPSDITYTRTYTLANGTIVVDNGRITGTLKCVVQPSASAATEVATWTVSLTGGTGNVLTPYWITSMTLNVYSGASATGTPVQTAKFSVDSTTYNTTMKAWVTTYFNLVNTNPTNPSAWVLGACPTVNPTWTVNFDTRTLANGFYTFQVAATWHFGVAAPSGISVPSPPSLSSTGGKAYFLSQFGLGTDVPPMPEAALPIVFIVIVIVVVAVAVYVKRRS
jgi:hypothetical protein